MHIIKQKRIYRVDLRRNPEVIYLFGDNLAERGFGGQAGEMRGEPNAIGIPTKKLPTMNPDAFFTDEEFEDNCKYIDQAFEKIPKETRIVVIPSDGLGTGLAMLPNMAMRTHSYLQSKIKELEDTDMYEENSDMKIVNGFVWKIISAIQVCKLLLEDDLFDVYELHDDGSESLVDDVFGLSTTKTYGIEVGTITSGIKE